MMLALLPLRRIATFQWPWSSMTAGGEKDGVKGTYNAARSFAYSAIAQRRFRGHQAASRGAMRL